MQSETNTGVAETIGPDLEPIADAGETLPELDETAGERDADGTGEPGEAVPGDTLTNEGPFAGMVERTADEILEITGKIPLGGGSGLAIAMAQAQNADLLAKAENGALSYGFDQTRAWQEIAALNTQVADRLRFWNLKKGEAKEAKDDYDEAVEDLTSRIAALDDERRKPKLAFVGAEDLTPGPKECPWEREHPGQACPMCRKRETGPAAVPAIDDPRHPDHPDHVTAVNDEADATFVARLADAEVFIDELEIAGMDLSAKAVLEQWLNERVVIAAAQANDSEVVPLPYPEVFARKAHRAGAPDREGGSGQACTKCGLALRDDVEVADTGGYPVGAHVGLDCEGAEDVARAPRRRGGAKKARRRAPEKDRAEQLEAAAAQADDTGGDEITD